MSEQGELGIQSLRARNVLKEGSVKIFHYLCFFFFFNCALAFFSYFEVEGVVIFWEMWGRTSFSKTLISSCSEIRFCDPVLLNSFEIPGRWTQMFNHYSFMHLFERLSLQNTAYMFLGIIISWKLLEYLWVILYTFWLWPGVLPSLGLVAWGSFRICLQACKYFLWLAKNSLFQTLVLT